MRKHDVVNIGCRHDSNNQSIQIVPPRLVLPDMSPRMWLPKSEPIITKANGSVSVRTQHCLSTIRIWQKKKDTSDLGTEHIGCHSTTVPYCLPQENMKWSTWRVNITVSTNITVCPTWTCLTCHVTVETVTQFVAKHHKKNRICYDLCRRS